MFVPFLFELRRRKVPVGLQEAIALAQALGSGLHDSSLDGFYHLARALLVHSEAHLDAFDQAFAQHFRGAERAGIALTEELLSWLQQARSRPELSEEERRLLEALDFDALQRMLEERLREQRERHDGGNRWIGTGGTSPFGHSGASRDGIRVGGAGTNRSAVQVAQARLFRGYRSDLVLDVRQMGTALRKLRAFAREGAPEELDVEGTIDATCRNAGELEVVRRPARRSNLRVVLLMDVGGSMDPFAALVSRLFSAASQATHFRELRTFYFHNCIRGVVYRQASLREPISLEALMAECAPTHKLLCVGDALMNPYELFEPTDAQGWYHPQGTTAIEWMTRLGAHFPSAVWLNPEPPAAWAHPTVRAIRHVWPMFPLTLDGLTEAVAKLTRRVGALR